MFKTERLVYTLFGWVALPGFAAGMVAGLVISPLATLATALGVGAYATLFVCGTRIQRRIEVFPYRQVLLEERERHQAALARCQAALARSRHEQAGLLHVLHQVRPDLVEAARSPYDS